MSKIIGYEATYTGTAHRWMRGMKVRVVAVTRDDDARFENDEDLAAGGGLIEGDCLEVQPWIEKEGRYSWATSDCEPHEIGLTASEVH